MKLMDFLSKGRTKFGEKNNRVKFNKALDIDQLSGKAFRLTETSSDHSGHIREQYDVKRFASFYSFGY
jgi:hypothetical protein